MISCIDETVSIGSDPSLPARKGPRKEPDKQAAYLHAAVRCAEEALLRRVAEGEARAEGAQAAEAVYERTVDRLAPTNAPAAKVDCPPLSGAVERSSAPTFSHLKEKETSNMNCRAYIFSAAVEMNMGDSCMC